MVTKDKYNEDVSLDSDWKSRIEKLCNTALSIWYKNNNIDQKELKVKVDETALKVMLNHEFKKQLGFSTKATKQECADLGWELKKNILGSKKLGDYPESSTGIAMSKKEVKDIVSTLIKDHSKLLSSNQVQFERLEYHSKFIMDNWIKEFAKNDKVNKDALFAMIKLQFGDHAGFDSKNYKDDCVKHGWELDKANKIVATYKDKNGGVDLNKLDITKYTLEYYKKIMESQKKKVDDYPKKFDTIIDDLYSQVIKNKFAKKIYKKAAQEKIQKEVANLVESSLSSTGVSKQEKDFIDLAVGYSLAKLKGNKSVTLIYNHKLRKKSYEKLSAKFKSKYDIGAIEQIVLEKFKSVLKIDDAFFKPNLLNQKYLNFETGNFASSSSNGLENKHDLFEHQITQFAIQRLDLVNEKLVSQEVDLNDLNKLIQSIDSGNIFSDNLDKINQVFDKVVNGIKDLEQKTKYLSNLREQINAITSIKTDSINLNLNINSIAVKEKSVVSLEEMVGILENKLEEISSKNLDELLTKTKQEPKNKIKDIYLLLSKVKEISSTVHLNYDNFNQDPMIAEIGQIIDVLDDVIKIKNNVQLNLDSLKYESDFLSLASSKTDALVAQLTTQEIVNTNFLNAQASRFVGIILEDEQLNKYEQMVISSSENCQRLRENKNVVKKINDDLKFADKGENQVKNKDLEIVLNEVNSLLSGVKKSLLNDNQSDENKVDKPVQKNPPNINIEYCESLLRNSISFSEKESSTEEYENLMLDSILNTLSVSKEEYLPIVASDKYDSLIDTESWVMVVDEEISTKVKLGLDIRAEQIFYAMRRYLDIGNLKSEDNKCLGALMMKHLSVRLNGSKYMEFDRDIIEENYKEHPYSNSSIKSIYSESEITYLIDHCLEEIFSRKLEMSNDNKKINIIQPTVEESTSQQDISKDSSPSISNSNVSEIEKIKSGYTTEVSSDQISISSTNSISSEVEEPSFLQQRQPPPLPPRRKRPPLPPTPRVEHSPLPSTPKTMETRKRQPFLTSMSKDKKNITSGDKQAPTPPPSRAKKGKSAKKNPPTPPVPRKRN